MITKVRIMRKSPLGVTVSDRYRIQTELTWDSFNQDFDIDINDPYWAVMKPHCQEREDIKTQLLYTLCKVSRGIQYAKSEEKKKALEAVMTENIERLNQEYGYSNSDILKMTTWLSEKMAKIADYKRTHHRVETAPRTNYTLGDNPELQKLAQLAQ